MLSQSHTKTIDRTRCPLCGESNTCGQEAGLDSCWCADLTFPRNPPQTVMSCFCRSCTEQLLEQELAATQASS